MTRLLQITLLLAGLSWCVPAHAAWTDQLHPAPTTCTTGTACRATVTLTAGWGVIAILNGTNSASSSTCCNAGCTATWTQAAAITSSNGRVEIWYCTNAAAGASLSVGPTWAAACATGPTCSTRIVAGSATGTITAPGASEHCTSSGTTQNPVTCSITTSSSSIFVGVGASFGGTLSVCSNSYTCTFPNGDGSGYKFDTAYNADTWTGNASNAYTTAAALLTDVSSGAAAATPPAGIMLGP